MIISPMTSMRPLRIIFEKRILIDMAYSFLPGETALHVDPLMEHKFRIACLLMAVCLLFDRLRVL
jgi:hypothetical protein